MSPDDQLKRVFEAAMAELAELTSAEKKRARQEGVEEGRTLGWEDGREQGRFEGRSEAEQESRVALDAAVEAVRAEALTDLAALDRLLDAARAIDRARSLGEVLDTLAGCAAREASRAAVLLSSDGRLRGWRFIGFDGVADDRTQEIDLDEAGVIRDAVRSAVVASGATASNSGAPKFANLETPEDALAMPIVLAGEVVAVLYADQGRRTASSPRGRKTWPAVLEIMVRHAARSLEAFTAIKAARAISAGPRASNRPVPLTVSGDDDSDVAAKRYAKLLVSEIKLYHEADVTAGRRERDLAARLGGEISRARVLYDERVPTAVRDRSNYFHDELVRTLADGDATLLQMR